MNERENSPNVQIIDTTNDYMELIFKEVEKFNHKRDVYMEIRNDYKIYIKDNNIVDIDDVHDWIYKYLKNTTQETQELVYNKYGQKRVLSNLRKIAVENSFYDMETLIKEDGEDMAYYCILTYIIHNEVLQDLIKVPN